MYVTIQLHHNQLDKCKLAWLIHCRIYSNFILKLIKDGLSQPSLGKTKTGRERKFWVNHHVISKVPAFHVDSINNKNIARVSFKGGNAKEKYLYLKEEIPEENTNQKISVRDYIGLILPKEGMSQFDYFNTSDRLHCKLLGSSIPKWKNEGSAIRAIYFRHSCEYPFPPGPHQYVPTTDNKKFIDIDLQHIALLQNQSITEETQQFILDIGRDINKLLLLRSEFVRDERKSQFYKDRLFTDENNLIQMVDGGYITQRTVEETINTRDKFKELLQLIIKTKKANTSMTKMKCISRYDVGKFYLLVRCLGEQIRDFFIDFNLEFICFTGGGFNMYGDFDIEKISDMVKKGYIDHQVSVQAQRIVGGIKMYSPMIQASTPVATNNIGIPVRFNIFKMSNPAFHVLPDRNINTNFGNVIRLYDWIDKTWTLTHIANASNIKYLEYRGIYSELKENIDLIWDRIQSHLSPVDEIIN